VHWAAVPGRHRWTAVDRSAGAERGEHMSLHMFLNMFSICCHMSAVVWAAAPKLGISLAGQLLTGQSVSLQNVARRTSGMFCMLYSSSTEVARTCMPLALDNWTHVCCLPANDIVPVSCRTIGAHVHACFTCHSTASLAAYSSNTLYPLQMACMRQLVLLVPHRKCACGLDALSRAFAAVQ
jgi:hypothetical protein